MTHKDMGLHQLGDAPGRARGKYGRYQTGTYWRMKRYRKQKYWENVGEEHKARLAAFQEKHGIDLVRRHPTLRMYRNSKRKVTLPVVNLPE